VSVSSARPGALDAAGAGFQRDGRRLEVLGDAVVTAAGAYARHCTDAPLGLAVPARTTAVVADVAVLADALHRIAAAFRTADTGGTLAPLRPVPGLAHVTDRALSHTVTAHHGPLAGALGGPTRAVAARGRALGRTVAGLVATRGAAHAVDHLLAHAGAHDLTDPLFAAGVVNGIGADRLRSMTDELAQRAVSWHHRRGPLTALSALWNTALRSLELAASAPRLDTAVLDQLLASAGGRTVLRLLLAASDTSPGAPALRHLRGPLLDRPAALDASVAPAFLLLLGDDRQGSADAGFLHALGREPEVALAWLTAAPGTSALEDRVHALLDADRHQLAAVSVLTGVLALRQLDPGHRDRTTILRATVAWVHEQGPTAVAEPLAQMLAEAVATDRTFFEGRLAGPGHELTSTFTAIARFERPWLTALVALQAHEADAVAETLHGDLASRLTALDRLDRLGRHLAAGAAAADQPVDHTAATFWLVNAGLGQALRAARLHPAAAMVATAVVERGVTAWQDAVVPERGDRELRTRLEMAGRERRIWIVIADDAELGPRIDWSVGGTGPDRHRTAGSRITGVDDLVALRGTPEDLDELAAWAAHQPDDLRVLVATYLEGVERPTG
jgi:hypothetical protein